MDTPTIPLTSEQMIQATRRQTSLYDGDYHFYDLQCGIQIHGGSLRARNNVACRRMAKPYLAFVLLLEGKLRFGIGSDYHEISAGSQGQAVLISLDHDALFTRFLSQGENLTKVTLNGLERWLPERPPDLLSKKVRYWALSSELSALARKWLQYPFNDDLSGNTNALHMLNTCWQTYNTKLSSDHSIHTKHDEKLALISELEQAYAQGATNIEALAQKLHVSRRTLQRRTHDTLGVTLQQWLLATRMQQAMTYLTTDKLSIGEVAYHVGYRHPSNFIQAFKHHFGITPATVLNQNIRSSISKNKIPS